MADSQSYHEYKARRFVNRPKVLDEIRKWADSPSVTRRVLSFAAPPGSGKTWILRRFYEERNNNPFTIWMNLPEFVNQQEKRDPNQMLNLNALVKWVETIWQNAQKYCPPPIPWDPTPDISAIVDKLVKILCDCNLHNPPLIIVEGYDEIIEQARIIERRLLDYLIDRDCMRMIIAYRDQDKYVLKSDTLRYQERQILLDTLDPLSPDFAREQFARLVGEIHPEPQNLSVDVWMSYLTHYEWNHPLANAFLFDRALSRDESKLRSLSSEDLKECCLNIITRPFEGEEAKYKLEDEEFSYLMKIANQLEKEWTDDDLKETCNLNLTKIARLFDYGLIQSTSPRRKIPDPILMLLRDLHQMQEGNSYE